MPQPKPNQSKTDYMKICIPQVQRDGTAKNPKQAVAICESMWSAHKKKSNA